MEDLREILLKCLREGTRYEHIEHIKAEALFNYRVLTGEDQDSLVVAYKERESEAQKKQRISITNTRTAYPTNKIFSKWKEVERADATVDNIWFDYEGDSKKRIDLLKGQLNDFSDNDTYNDYLHEAVRRLNFYDPNALIVIAFKDTAEGLKTYPLEIHSENIVDFKKADQGVQWVIASYPIKVIQARTPSGLPMLTLDSTETYEGLKYYAYGTNEALVLTEVGDVHDLTGEVIEVKDKASGKIKKYILETYQHNSGVTPAFQIGYLKDPRTKWKTYVSPLFPAREMLKDLINTKSEYDLHKALHGFAQKFAYVEDCDYIDPETSDRCRGGFLSNTGRQCGSCKGSGVKVHTTVQDVVLIRKPGSKEEHIPLSEYVHYVTIPEALIQRHRDDIEWIERTITQAVLSTDIFDRQEIADTATGKRLDLQSFYNVLTEYNLHFCELYKKGVLMIARHLDMEEGLAVEKSITKDYRLETIDELLEQRRKAVDANSPYDIIAAIDLALLAKQNQDNDLYIAQIQARERFRPWRDKTREEVMFALAMLPELHPSKILWLFFNDIFEKIFADPAFKLFHTWKYDVQKAAVDAIVTQVINEQRAYLTTPTFADAARTTQ